MNSHKRNKIQIVTIKYFLTCSSLFIRTLRVLTKFSMYKLTEIR